MEYINANDMIIGQKISLCEPFLYNGCKIVTLPELNDWAYFLLIKTNDDKNHDVQRRNGFLKEVYKDLDYRRKKKI